MQDPEQGGAIAAPVKALLAFFDATDEWDGSPLHEELVRQVDRQGIAGATVLNAIMGVRNSPADTSQGSLRSCG